MSYLKAYKGIKKLFIAGILSLVGSFCIYLAILPGILGISAAFSGSLGGFFAGGIIALFLLLASLLLPVIAYVLEVVGLGQAEIDEREFHQGFLFAILALIFILVETLFTAFGIEGSVVNGIVETVANTLDVAVAVCVVGGIQNLSAKLENYKMVQNGSSLVRFITIFYAVNLFAILISVLFGSNIIMQLLAGLLAFITGLLNLVIYIIYLVYLGKAMKMLKRSKGRPIDDTISTAANMKAFADLDFSEPATEPA